MIPKVGDLCEYFDGCDHRLFVIKEIVLEQTVESFKIYWLDETDRANFTNFLYPWNFKELPTSPLAWKVLK